MKISACNEFSTCNDVAGLPWEVLGEPNHVDRDTRERIRSWLRYVRVEYYEKVGKTDGAMAADMEIAPATLSNILSGKRTAGLDVVLSIRRAFKIPTDSILLSEPPHRAGESPSPSSASPSTARPGKRSGGSR